MERERRKYSRADIRVNATITVDGQDISVTTKNISRSGMLLDATDPIEEFTVIAVTLELPYLNGEIKINCEGVIVRAAMGFESAFPYSLAVHFIDIEEASGDEISAYVDSALSGN